MEYLDPIFLVSLPFIVAFFVWLAIVNLIQERKPMVEQRATVIAKRQEVTGGVGVTPVMTQYYVTFELEGGGRTELPVEGHDFGLMIEGDRGTLSVKGNLFKGFQRQRLPAR